MSSETIHWKLISQKPQSEYSDVSLSQGAEELLVEVKDKPVREGEILLVKTEEDDLENLSLLCP